MTTTIIEMTDAGEYKSSSYGIRQRSVCTFTIQGRDVHNSGSQHTLQLWDNTVRPSSTYPVPSYKEHQVGAFISPEGDRTDEPWSLLFSAEATVIADTPVDRPARGGVLVPGDFVVLRQPDGTLSDPYRVQTKFLHDPHLAQV